MKTILQFITAVIVSYLILDVFGFLFWILSNQYPPEGSYYIGKLTVIVLSIIF